MASLTTDDAMSGFGMAMRTHTGMRPLWMTLLVATLAIAGLMASAPSLLAQSAVDQYSESLPTGGGPKPSREAIGGAGSPAEEATVPPATRAELEKSKEGAAAARAAKITAPSPSQTPGGPDAGETATDEDGLGLLLPLLLAASLLVALGLLLARRRHGAASG